MLQKRISRSTSERALKPRRNKVIALVNKKTASKYRRFFYTQPWSQTALLLNSRHPISRLCLSMTASNSTYSTACSGRSGSMTLVTKKCFRWWVGWTAVHLLSSNFLGLSGFFCLEGIALKFSCIADEEPATRRKYFAWIFDFNRAL